MAETAAAETTSALLNRAADRLDALHRAALDAPWWMDGNEIMQMDRGSLQPEPSSIGRVAEEDGDLIVALRPVAAPLAHWMRRTVKLAGFYHDDMVPEARDEAVDAWLHVHHAPAVQIARAVLGETDGG